MPTTCPYPEPDQSSPLGRSYQTTTRGQRPFWTIRNRIRFDGEELLAPRPTPKLEDYPLSAVRDCLFNLFAATFHIGGRSSIRNLRTRHAVVTGTHITWGLDAIPTEIWKRSYPELGQEMRLLNEKRHRCVMSTFECFMSWNRKVTFQTYQFIWCQLTAARGALDITSTLLQAFSARTLIRF